MYHTALYICPSPKKKKKSFIYIHICVFVTHTRGSYVHMKNRLTQILLLLFFKKQTYTHKEKGKEF